MKTTSAVTAAAMATVLLSLPSLGATKGEMLFWQSIMNSQEAADYQAYLKQYPKGDFAALARARIAALGGAVSPAAPAARPAAAAPRAALVTAGMVPSVQVSVGPLTDPDMLKAEGIGTDILESMVEEEAVHGDNTPRYRALEAQLRNAQAAAAGGYAVLTVRNNSQSLPIFCRGGGLFGPNNAQFGTSMIPPGGEARDVVMKSDLQKNYYPVERLPPRSQALVDRLEVVQGKYDDRDAALLVSRATILCGTYLGSGAQTIGAVVKLELSDSGAFGAGQPLSLALLSDPKVTTRYGGLELKTPGSARIACVEYLFMRPQFCWPVTASSAAVANEAWSKIVYAYQLQPVEEPPPGKSFYVWTKDVVH